MNGQRAAEKEHNREVNQYVGYVPTDSSDDQFRISRPTIGVPLDKILSTRFSSTMTVPAATQTDNPLGLSGLDEPSKCSFPRS